MNCNRRGFLKRSAAGAAVLAAGSGMFSNSAFAMNPSRFQEKSDVSFVASSSAGTRRKMIADVLEPWRQTIAAGIEGKTVIIKPNLVYYTTVISDKVLPLTHIDAIRGCIDFLRSISTTVPILIGDIPAYASPDLQTMVANLKYDVLTSEYTGVSFADLNDADDFPTVYSQLWTPDFTTASLVTIPISSAFTDPKYYVISITRPKTHNCMVMTAINKNVLMAAPLNKKVENGKEYCPKPFMHGAADWRTGDHTNENKCLSYNLFQLANVIYPTGTPALSVLDVWEGMEGDGPVYGKSVMQYCAVAGIDPLAVDRLCAKLMGFSDTATDPINKNNPSYTDMRALVWISNAGFGNYDLSKINFILGSITDLEKCVKKYAMSPNYTGNPSYCTNWTGGPPQTILDVVSVRDSRFLDPKPYLAPQARKGIPAGRITINFSLPVSFKVTLSVYNLKGDEIRRLGNETLTAGRYSMVWDGRNARGSRVPAGNYVIKLNYGSGFLSERISIVN